LSRSATGDLNFVHAEGVKPLPYKPALSWERVREAGVREKQSQYRPHPPLRGPPSPKEKANSTHLPTHHPVILTATLP